MLERYRRFRPFSDREAWTLFKLAAFGEAIGWSLLICGIACKQLPVSWSGIPVLITGQIHGMLFMVYIAAALVLGPSLKWPIWRITLAGLCSVPPYGSLVYEQVSAHYRFRSKTRVLRRLVVYRQLTAA